jgi:hypothetical protein
LARELWWWIPRSCETRLLIEDVDKEGDIPHAAFGRNPGGIRDSGFEIPVVSYAI